MFFRNKFDEEFLYLANNISPKGGSVRLDEKYPLFFVFERPPYDEWGRRVIVKPLLLYNKITSTNIKDKIVEDWIVLCENKKDTIIRCTWEENYFSEQERDFVCNLNYVNINGDLVDDVEEYAYNDPDYNYEEV